jgi:hypothetical protein
MSLEKLQALGGAILPGTKLPALDSIKGLGPARIKQLNAAGIFTIIDLILRLPRDYDDRRIPRSIGSLYSRQGSGRGVQPDRGTGYRVFLRPGQAGSQDMG